MAGVIENYCKFKARAVVGFLQAEGMSQSEIHRRLASVYGQKVFSTTSHFSPDNGLVAKAEVGSSAVSTTEPQSSYSIFLLLPAFKKYY
jgi:hypothetical protein